MTETGKRGRGRPKILEETQHVMIRVPVEFLAQVDALAERLTPTLSGIPLAPPTRSELFRMLAEKGLEALQQPTPPAPALEPPVPSPAPLEPPAAPVPASLAPPAPVVSDAPAPAFDASKLYLGDPCPHGHRHGDTGLTLRRVKDKECPACHRARVAVWRARKKAGHAGSE